VAVACHAAPGNSKKSSRKIFGRLLLRFIQRILIAGSVFALLLAIAYTFRDPLCKLAAHAWIVGSTLERNYDIAIIPGGGLQTRPFAAADLFHEGKVEGLVSFLTEVMPAEEMGLTRPADEVTLEILDKLAVPREKIHIIGDHVTSTQDEVLAVKEWAVKNEVKSLVVLTEIFPSRRAARVYEREFEGTGITTEVFALSPGSYTADNWWQHEQGLISFQNEVIKYFYYLLKY
jgi:uncharacterized SAM-binding protein YcdF (DUF218 family)